MHTLTNFYATAYTDDLFFDDLQFTFDGGNSYASNPVYYWPKGKKMWFYAYAPSMGESTTVTINKEVQKIENFTVNPDIYEQQDFVYATNTGEEDSGLEETSSIPITFYHMLSKIDIKVYTSDDSGLYSYKFAGAKIGGVALTGDVDLATAIEIETESDSETTTAWSDFENKGVVTFTRENDPLEYEYGGQHNRVLGEIPGLQTDYLYDNYAFMIPQSLTPWDPENDPTNRSGGAYISVLVQINKKENGIDEETRVYPAEGDYGWVAVPIPTSTYNAWRAGYGYYYTLDFTNGAGYFEPTADASMAGKSVLGDPVKVTVSLLDMPDAETGVVVNQDMIGRWEAYQYVEQKLVYDFSYDESGNIVYNMNSYTTVPVETYTDSDEIAQNTNYFSKITIDDGTTLWTKVLDGNNNLTDRKTEYTAERPDDGSIVLYIDCYKNTDGEGYSMIPRIVEINQVAGENYRVAKVIPWHYDEDGTFTDEDGVLRKYGRELELMYKIYPLETESGN